MLRYPYGVEVVEEGFERTPEERRFMTICVAAFAAKSKAIVLVSDKGVTRKIGSGSASMQWDVGVKKILSIGETDWRVLVAGDPSFALRVVHQTEVLINKPKSEYEHADKSCHLMMQCVTCAYKDMRKEAVQDRILEPLLLDKQLLTERPRTLLPLPDDSFDSILTTVGELKTDCSLLVCGFDAVGAHIFSVSDPGESGLHDMTGFNTIGIGAAFAWEKLVLLETERDKKLEEILYNLFDAKANAELVQGVGYEWDAEIIVEGRKPTPVPKPIKNLIEGIFSSTPDSPFAKEQKKPENWQARLKAYCDSVLIPKPKKKGKRRGSQLRRRRRADK